MPAMPAMPIQSSSEHAALARFWRRHGVLVAALTGLLGMLSVVPPLLAKGVRQPLFGMPLSMWLMAELAPIAFVGIAWFYAHRADALEAEYVESTD